MVITQNNMQSVVSTCQNTRWGCSVQFVTRSCSFCNRKLFSLLKKDYIIAASSYLVSCMDLFRLLQGPVQFAVVGRTSSVCWFAASSCLVCCKGLLFRLLQGAVQTAASSC